MFFGSISNANWYNFIESVYLFNAAYVAPKIFIIITCLEYFVRSLFPYSSDFEYWAVLYRFINLFIEFLYSPSEESEYFDNLFIPSKALVFFGNIFRIFW